MNMEMKKRYNQRLEQDRLYILEWYENTKKNSSDSELLNRAVTWDDIDIYVFTDFEFNSKIGRMPRSIKLRNGEVISIGSWINRVQQHIDKNKHQHLFDALKDFWIENPNGYPPEYAAYKSYASKAFNTPTFAAYKDFKTGELYIESLGDVYPWPGSWRNKRWYL